MKKLSRDKKSTFTFIHLADTFIQSGLQCISNMHLSV